MGTKMSLKDKIGDQIKETTEEGGKWIPLLSIENLITDSEVVAVLKAANKINLEDNVDKWKNFILGKAKRLFALLVRFKHVDWLDLFCRNDFGDNMFPITLLESDAHTGTASHSKPKWTIQSTRMRNTISSEGLVDEDDREVLEDICEKQWIFFVPVFSPNDPAHVFERWRRMPFWKELESLPKTNFSIVTRYVIHRSHLDFLDDDQIVRNYLVF